MSRRTSTGTGAAAAGIRARQRVGCAALAAAALMAAVLAGCTTTTTVSRDDSPPPINNADAAAINVQLGVDYLQKNELALAQDKLQRAESEDSHSANVHGALALLDERLGDARGADREYRRALELSHRSPEMLNNYAVYLCSHGRPTEGVGYFEEAAKNPLYPTPWAAYTNAGICLRGVHHDVEAMQRFAHALQLDPGFADAAYEAASLQYAQQHFVAARLQIDLFLMNNRPTPSLLLLGWQIARAQGDDVGRQRYATLLGRDFPGSAQAHALEMANRSGPD